MALDPKDIAKLVEELKKSLDQQQELNDLSNSYAKTIKKIKDMQTTIKALQEDMVKQRLAESDAQKELNKAYKSGNKKNIDDAKKQLEIEKAKIKWLDDEVKKNKQLSDLLATQLKTSTKMGSIFKQSGKDLMSVVTGIKTVYAKLHFAEIFDMSKAIKTSALQMGILSNQSQQFSKDIQAAAMDTIDYGVGIGDIAKLQATYSDELGRTVQLGKEGAKALASMSVATGLGAEGSAKMAADFDQIGISAQRTAEYVEQTMNDAHALGINSSKIIKNISNNISLLNKYNFKNGVKGLADMAKSTTKLGVDMSFASGFADKLLDIEGAVDMSAQLQVLGGEWAKLADPFKLMNMARNDMEGLTKAITDATASTAKFNSKTGEFDISALEMSRLRTIAQQTGLALDDLVKSGKNAAKFTKIKSQISINVDKDTQEFIASTAQLDKTGKASIQINGGKKYLDTLNESDKAQLLAASKQRESMEQRAKDSQTFDDQLKNTYTMFKQLLVPLVEAINTKLGPTLQGLVTKFKDPKFLDGILKFSESIGNFIAGVGNFIVKFPKLSAGLFIMFEAGKWLLNGIALGKGFNMTASVGGGGGGGGGSMLGGISKGLGTKLGGALGGAAVGGVNALSANSIGEGVGNVAGGAIGGLLGSFLGPLGTALGGQLGSMLGGAIGDAFSGKKKGSNEGPSMINDGIIKFNDKDKFTKVDDGTMIAGTNENGNKDLARAIQNSSAPNFQNKEKLISGARNGQQSGGMGGGIPGSLNVTFGEIKFGGSIELKSGGNSNPEVGRTLLNTPSFIRDITKMIHMETSNAISGINQQRVGK
jgi:hypothetical protein